VTGRPKISVLLTTYNRRQLLERAVASVLAQDEVDFELIVVDDCSSDGTGAWLATLSDPRVRVVSSPRNMGIAATRNLGLEAARADIIAMLDDDDVYLSGRLSVPLAIFASNAGVVGALSSIRKVGEKRATVAQLPDANLPPELFEWALLCDLLDVDGSGMTFRRQDALAIGGFNGGLKRHEDREFMLRLAQRGSGQLISNILWQKNWTAGSITSYRDLAGHHLHLYFLARPDYLTRFRKVGTYLATKALVTDIRHLKLAAFLRDLRDFRGAGLIDGNVARMWRDHREVRRYRRAMSKPDRLAALPQAPDTWR
jgi:glycosyltransferase involved in cell wall biosynthesis